MKKSLLALAALTAFAGAASAQSSVTLFGIVDAGVARLSADGKSLTGMTNSGYNGSRFGVRGVEDMGGGLMAGFWLEGQLTNDDGNAGGLNFQRRSTVSLMGGFGEIRMGRDYTPTFWNTTVYDPFGTNGVGQARTPGMTTTLWNVAVNGGAKATPRLTVPAVPFATGQAVRANNSISYFTPNMGGASVQAMYAFGENVSGGAKTNNYFGVRAGYAAGPISAHVAYGKSKGAGAAAIPAIGLPALTASDTDVTYANIGASFDAGFIKPMFQVAQQKTGEGSKSRGILAGALVPVGAGVIRVAYSQIKASGTSDLAFSQLAAGYVHNLSKRTSVYGTYALINNKDLSNVAVSNNGLSVANWSAGVGKNSSGFEFGVRHAF